LARVTVGGLEWARAGGILRPRDRAQLLAQGAAMQLRDLPWSLLARAGVRPRGTIAFDAAALAPPDSAAARDAEELCREIRPAALIGHSHRTYAWATILASQRRAPHDAEALYVSSLLHDLGLSDHARQARAPHPSCFTAIGADAAERVGIANGWERGRARLAAEAITLHMNLSLRDHTPEARLMLAGAQLDVLGTGAWRLAPATLDGVLARWPRAGTKAAVHDAFRREARANPGTRAHFYWRHLAMAVLIRLAPFED
jgi:hypothetical protein